MDRLEPDFGRVGLIFRTFMVRIEPVDEEEKRLGVAEIPLPERLDGRRVSSPERPAGRKNGL